MIIKNISSLSKKKDKAIFLGCGKSINKINKKNIENISKNFDVWSSNGFFLHDFIIPDFYHIEVNLNYFGFAFSNDFQKSKENFKKTEFIFDQSNLNFLKFIDFSGLENLSSYTSYLGAALTSGYDNHPFFVRNSECNLSKIIDIMIKMKYSEINFLGVDLNSSEYFWSDRRINIDNLVFSKPDENARYCLHHSALKTIKFLEGISKIQENRSKIKFINLNPESLLKTIENDFFTTKELF